MNSLKTLQEVKDAGSDDIQIFPE